ncbi:ABC transporter permease [Corynebacterium jeikeium]|uniref:ABC transporter permease n=1 Tax=Corynebacterium jeikeium TaxID=38289 RepID=UPI00087F9977|nr:ABC transporter permease [Corynebacterium jeikeium]SCX13390.1 ABC-2 type transporter [Corynebacterium jeikeium]
MPLTHKSSNESATEAGPRFRRYRSLAVAEVRQYLRNKTLLFMAVIFPIGVAFLVQFMGRSDQGGSSLIRTATSMEVFFLITLMFVQFYSVLSMASTRRDERVLKRLRTGESRDLEILTALATPGAIMTVTLTLLMTAILIAYTGDVPRSGVLLLLIVIFGIAISTALALLTSAITANAEAAQMTSLPVMALAMLSQSPLRSALPEQIQDPLSRTPFALIGDLTFIEWTGKPFGQNADTSAGGLASTIDQATHPLGLLLVWAAVLAWAALRYMKWETNR